MPDASWTSELYWAVGLGPILIEELGLANPNPIHGKTLVGLTNEDAGTLWLSLQIVQARH